MQHLGAEVLLLTEKAMRHLRKVQGAKLKDTAPESGQRCWKGAIPVYHILTNSESKVSSTRTVTVTTYGFERILIIRVFIATTLESSASN
jgi:hypothetical protein